MDRLAADCGASDPVFSPSLADRGWSRLDLELGLRAALGFAMDRFVLLRRDLYHLGDQHFPFRSAQVNDDFFAGNAPS
jgi:hypothetical protein